MHGAKLSVANLMNLLPFAALAIVSMGASRANAVDTLPLLYADDFEHGIDRWQTTDPDPAKPF